MHRITKVCNCRCEICDWWKAEGYDRDRELDTGSLASIFYDAARSGITEYAVYGGEALLREDFDRVLYEARQAGLNTSTCTNGTLLKERARELADNMHYCLVSIDGMAATHDRIRGVKGVFDKAVSGLEELRRTDRPVRLRFWSQINRANLGELKEIVKLAKDFGGEVDFIPTFRVEGYNDHLILEPGEGKEALDEIIDMKKRGYPVVNLFSTLRSFQQKQPFVCNYPRLSVTLDYDGSASPCGTKMDDHLEWAGSLSDFGIGNYVKDPRYRQMAKDWENCNDCTIACAMGTKNNLIVEKLSHLVEQLYIELSGLRAT